MRLSYSQIKAAHFRNIGKAGQFQDQNLIDDFQYSLGTRYQLIWDVLASYINEDAPTDVTVNGTQYYPYPIGSVSLDTVTITIGSMQYSLDPIYDQSQWDKLNALTIQPTALPRFFFPRRDDYGIWPIPTGVWTISTKRFFRDRNLLVEDVTGTGTVTLNSATLTGTGFTPAMVGRWFTITDTTVPGQGYWLRIAAYVSATQLTLQRTWTFATATSKAYLIGETPELPEGAHILLPDGTSADFYSGLKNDVENASRFDNKFWTGSMANTSRKMDDKNISGGLIGLFKRFKDRDRDNIVERDPVIARVNDKIFATVISE